MQNIAQNNVYNFTYLKVAMPISAVKQRDALPGKFEAYVSEWQTNMIGKPIHTLIIQ